MKIRKEEIAGTALAIFAIVGWVVIGSRVAGRGEWPMTFYHPVFGLPIGLLALGILVWGLSKGHFGHADRNGRLNRPFVYWATCFFFGSMAVLLPLSSVVALSQ